MAWKKAKPFNSLGGIWLSERGVSSLCTFRNEQVSRVRQLLKDIGGPASASGVIPEINEHQTPLFSEIWMRFPASAFDALLGTPPVSRLAFVRTCGKADEQEPKEVASLMEPDVGLFYYGGHGLPVQGENYLVPVDAKGFCARSVPRPPEWSPEAGRLRRVPPYRPVRIGAIKAGMLGFTAFSPMSDLAARLESLLRLYAAASDQGIDDRLAERFRKDLALLVAEYGSKTVDAALDAMPDEAWPSVFLH
jgi:hypothetical protein